MFHLVKPSGIENKLNDKLAKVLVNDKKLSNSSEGLEGITMCFDNYCCMIYYSGRTVFVNITFKEKN